MHAKTLKSKNNPYLKNQCILAGLCVKQKTPTRVDKLQMMDYS